MLPPVACACDSPFMDLEIVAYREVRQCAQKFSGTSPDPRFGMTTPPASHLLAVGGAFKSGASESFGKVSAVALQRPVALLLADDAFKPGQ